MVTRRWQSQVQCASLEEPFEKRLAKTWASPLFWSYSKSRANWFPLGAGVRISPSALFFSLNTSVAASTGTVKNIGKEG